VTEVLKSTAETEVECVQLVWDRSRSVVQAQLCRVADDGAIVANLSRNPGE